MNNKIFGGADKKGGQGDAFTEAPDNLFSVSKIQIADMISEGEIHGFAKDDPLKCIYLDAVPIRNDNEENFDGPVNFARVDIDLKFGTTDQEPLENINETFRSVSIGKRVLHSLPQGVSYTVNDKNVTKAELGIRVNRLSLQTLGTAVTVGGNTISFSIYINGTLYNTYTIEGKTSNGYVRQYDIALGNIVNELGYATIKVVNETPDSTSQLDAHDLQIDYINEVIPNRFNYPYTCLCGMTVDSKSFSSLPRRQYHMKFLKILLPSNYNPDTREYTGDWDGTFSESKWSDNPAWILYDILTNQRYGFGDITGCDISDFVDKWTLYQIAQYCDELVPSGTKDSDGNDILEPRFTCNVALYNRDAIVKVVENFCQIFRGMPIWYSNKLTFSQDGPKDVMALFTNANIAKDGFTYTGSTYMQRYSVAVIYFNDKANFYEKQLVYVEDPEAIKRIGYKEIELETFGCTSKSQAIRVGKWAVFSSFYESELVAFKTGYEALALRIGDVIEIFDNERFLVRRSGRLQEINPDRNILKLDGEVYIDPSKENKIHVVIPNGKLSIWEITDSNQIGDTNIAQYEVKNIVAQNDQPYYSDTIYLDSALSRDIIPLDSAYVIESKSFDPDKYFYQDQEEFNELLANMQANFSNFLKAVDLYQSKPKSFRVIGIKEGGNGVFEISALEYQEGKYDAIEKGLLIDSGSIQPIPATWYPSAPTNLAFNKLSSSSIKFTWNDSIDKVKYGNDVSYVVTYITYGTNGSTETALGSTSETNFLLENIPNGFYAFTVRTLVQGFNSFPSGVYSLQETVNFSFGSIWNGDLSWEGNATIDSSVLYISDFKLSNGYNTTGYANSGPKFTWNLSSYLYNSDIQSFNINIYNPNGTLVHAEDIPPTGAGFNYTYDILTNISATGGPFRRFGIKVGIRDNGGIVSGYSNLLTVNNPAPQKTVQGDTLNVSAGLNSLVISQSWLTTQYLITGAQYKQGDYDIVGTSVYYSTGIFTTGNINADGTPSLSYLNVYNNGTPTTQFSFPVDPTYSYYVGVANYDTFGKYSLNLSNVALYSPYGSSSSPPGNPSSLILTSDLITGNNGYQNLRLSGTWNPSTSSDVLFYNFAIRESGIGDYKDNLTKNNFYYIDNVEPTTAYQIKVAAVSSLGLTSNYITGNHTTPAVSVSPASVASVPLGGMLMMPRGIIPAAVSGTFVLADGRPLATGVYVDLFNQYGFAFGAVGSTGFRIPQGNFNPDFPMMIRIA